MPVDTKQEHQFGFQMGSIPKKLTCSLGTVSTAPLSVYSASSCWSKASRVAGS